MRRVSTFAVILAATAAAGPMDDAEKYYLKGLYPSAIAACKKALEYDMNKNNRAHCWYMMGQAYMLNGETKSARSAFSKILSRYSTTAWLADAYVGIGDAYFRDGDYRTAIAYYKNSMTRSYLARHGATVYHRLARAHRKLGETTRATYYESVIRKQYPHSLEARVTLAGGSAAPAPRQVHHVYAVQVSYTTRADYAREYAQKLKRKGYDAYVRIANANGRTRYKVLIGRYSGIEAANALMRKIKSRESTDAFVTRVYD